MSEKSERRNSSTPSPVAHESGKTARIRSSSTSSTGIGRDVDLVQDDDLRQLLEAVAVGAELAVDGVELLGRVARGGVDHVHEHAGALEVREELVPEADALGGALDQAGHVGDDELARRPARRRCRGSARAS